MRAGAARVDDDEALAIGERVEAAERTHALRVSTAAVKGQDDRRRRNRHCPEPASPEPGAGAAMLPGPASAKSVSVGLTFPVNYIIYNVSATPGP